MHLSYLLYRLKASWGFKSYLFLFGGPPELSTGPSPFQQLSFCWLTNWWITVCPGMDANSAHCMTYEEWCHGMRWQEHESILHLKQTYPRGSWQPISISINHYKFSVWVTVYISVHFIASSVQKWRKQNWEHLASYMRKLRPSVVKRLIQST